MKYHIIICAILKDETPYLVEWVEHHLRIGIEHFVLYDNNSAVPARLTLEDYIRKGLVEVIDCKIPITPQLKAYTHCLCNMYDQTRWLAYIDLDEYIILKQHNDIHSFLSDYGDCAGVCLNWVIYTANNHISKPEGSVLENFTEPMPLDFAANRHVKSIIRPATVNTIDSAHYARYNDGFYGVNEKHRIVPQALSEFSNDVAQINHYFTKSFEEWLGKVERGIADSNQGRKVNEFWHYNPGMLQRQAEVNQFYRNFIRSLD